MRRSCLVCLRMQWKKAFGGKEEQSGVVVVVAAATTNMPEHELLFNSKHI